jgi:hypothetical protein
MFPESSNSGESPGKAEGLPMTINWNTQHHCHPLRCFVIDCQKEAQHLVRLRYGEAIIQACLCDACHTKPPNTILKSLVKRSGAKEI